MDERRTEMTIVLLIMTLFCGVQAVHAPRLLDATLWLAAVSALVAAIFYEIGAWQIAAIELSVGTGLVTVLMVFAITMVGNEREIAIRRRFPLLLIIVGVVLLTTLTAPFIPVPETIGQQPVSDVLWQARGLDMVLQVALIFSGVLGVIGLLSTTRKAASHLQNFVATPDAKSPEPNLNTAEQEAA
jgi:uncharacterized MnhB-related membrane protein